MAQRTAEEKLALLRQHEDGVPWSRISKESGVPVRTLGRWAATYRATPTSRGLARSRRTDSGTRRMPAELIEIVEALALRRPEPTAAFVYRRVTDIAHDRELPAPSYTSVRKVIGGIDPGLRVLAQQGDAAYRDRFELVFRRTTTGPNNQWQADHTLLDVAILDKAGASVRPWLTIVLDDYSRAIAGYALFIGAPTAEQTALAVHQAVNRKTNPAWPIAGLPDVLYSDHGSDFTSALTDRNCTGSPSTTSGTPRSRRSWRCTVSTSRVKVNSSRRVAGTAHPPSRRSKSSLPATTLPAGAHSRMPTATGSPATQMCCSSSPTLKPRRDELHRVQDKTRCHGVDGRQSHGHRPLAGSR